MATLKEIRDCMMRDLQTQGWNTDELAEFADQFDRNARLRSGDLITTEVEMVDFYAWADQQYSGWFLTSMRSRGHEEVRKYYR